LFFFAFTSDVTHAYMHSGRYNDVARAWVLFFLGILW